MIINSITYGYMDQACLLEIAYTSIQINYNSHCRMLPYGLGF